MKTWLCVVVLAAALGACKETNSNFCSGANADNNCDEKKIDGGGNDAATGCTSNATCTTAGLTTCDTTDGKCVQCTATSAGACTMTSPVCGAGDTCRACELDTECASDVCLPSGACADSGAVLYAGSNGTGTACSSAAPCALAQAVTLISGTKNIIKLAAGTYTISAGINLTSAATLIGTGAALDGSTNSSGASTLSFSGGGAYEIDYLEIKGTANGDGIGCNNGAILVMNELRIHNNSKIGIDASGCTVSLFRSVVAVNAAGGVSLNNTDFTLINNIVTQNGSLSSSIGGLLLAPKTTSGYTFAFNTVADNENIGANVSTRGVSCPNPVNGTNIILSNNNASSVSTTPSTTCLFNYSLYDNSGTAAGTHDVSGVAMFQSGDVTMTTSSAYYRIGSGSPAIGAGDPASTVQIDIDGDPRPDPTSHLFDVGADQFKP